MMQTGPDSNLIHPRRETHPRLTEVHVSGICLRRRPADRELEVLLARRSADREIEPGKLECCGGAVWPNESFVDAAIRHYRTELGMQVRCGNEPCRIYAIHLPQRRIIPGVRLLCVPDGPDPAAAPTSPNHAEVFWHPISEIWRIPPPEFAAGLADAILGMARLFPE